MLLLLLETHLKMSDFQNHQMTLNVLEPSIDKPTPNA